MCENYTEICKFYLNSYFVQKNVCELMKSVLVSNIDNGLFIVAQTFKPFWIVTMYDPMLQCIYSITAILQGSNRLMDKNHLNLSEINCDNSLYFPGKIK